MAGGDVLLLLKVEANKGGGSIAFVVFLAFTGLRGVRFPTMGLFAGETNIVASGSSKRSSSPCRRIEIGN
jgi:hypothetical protein